VEILSPSIGSLNNTLAFTVERCDSIGLLAGLDMEGICASSGSACSVGSLEPSHVVIAMGVSREKANALVRLSLGKENTPQQIDRVAQMLPTIINRCQPVNG
jgi:cysteine desulfurase